MSAVEEYEERRKREADFPILVSADAAIAELKEQVEATITVLNDCQAHMGRQAAEVERLKYAADTGKGWKKRAEAAEAEVERLTWMLEAAYEYGGFGGLYAAEYDDWLADLARRWEEHRADH